MEEDRKAPHRRSWLRFWGWVALYAVIFLAVILTTLSALGGKGETLKSGINQFFTRASGHPAHVETLEGLYFFPDFRMDIAGLDIRDKDDAARELVHLESLKMAMGFWDMTLRTGRIEALDLKGLRFAPGFVHPREITIGHLSLLHPEGKAPFLDGAGMIGGVPWAIRFDLESVGMPPRLTYRFAARREFSLMLGDLAMQGLLADEPDGLVIEEFSLKNGGREVLRGRPVLRALGAHELHIGGALEVSDQKGGWEKISPDVTFLYDEKEGVISALGPKGDARTDKASPVFEILRQSLQKGAGYPDQAGGKPALLLWPLVFDIAGNAAEGAKEE